MFRCVVRVFHVSALGMHDGCAGAGAEGGFLAALDDLGIAQNMIVRYFTDNGPHCSTCPDTCPDVSTTTFRSENNSNGERAYRVPAFARWPARRRRLSRGSARRRP